LGFFLGGNGGGADGSGVETVGSVWFVSSGISGTVVRLFLVVVEFFGAVVGDVEDEGHGGRLAADSFLEKKKPSFLCWFI
jgi:hypothetical protein